MTPTAARATTFPPRGAALALALAGCRDPEVASAPFDEDLLFDARRVGRVDIALPDDELARLLADPEAEEYVHGDFRFADDEAGADWAVPDVGVRFKGNASLDPGLAKNPLKIKFDEYVDGQALGRLEKVSLGTEYGDPTFLREATGYAVLRAAGLDAPRTRYVTVAVNGRPWGLYLLTEELDDVYLDGRFADPDGALYEATRCPLLYWGDDPAAYADGNGAFVVQAGEGDGDALVALARVLSTAEDADLTTELEARLDVDAWLRLLAIETLLVDLDSPLYSAANAFFYEDPRTARLTVLAWDLDGGFGGFPTFASVDARAGLSPWDPTLTGDPRPLIDRVLSVPGYQERYLSLLAELRASVAGPAALQDRILDTWARISAPYGEDPARIYPWATVVGALTQDTPIEDAARRYPEPSPGLLPFVWRRDAALAAALAGPPAWPASVRFESGVARVDLAVPGAEAGRVTAFVQTRSAPEADWITLVQRADEVDGDTWREDWPVAWPVGTVELRVVAILDLDRDGWADPGRDRWGADASDVAPGPAGEVAFAVEVGAAWEGEAQSLGVFGAPVSGE